MLGEIEVHGDPGFKLGAGRRQIMPEGFRAEQAHKSLGLTFDDKSYGYNLSERFQNLSPCMLYSA